ncbi:hypothetical protein [Halocynthiibacter styelae]|uniref:Uncharacterized protein n=1 Tax=Halocynthiibacter styelae TaxID=2761955 RepID=A0A8J7IFN3_9RHOB|nr:hypothetical protein [Paenihalocynthiibacter styelae]MBI1495222.1 hypothetical protein [Paenihalocynthiibacter styelae]
MAYIQGRPPANTLFAHRWGDFGPELGSAVFIHHTSDGKSHSLVIEGRRRQVLEALIHRPVCSASRCRISEAKRVLAKEYGLEIETRYYQPEKGVNISGSTS